MDGRWVRPGMPPGVHLRGAVLGADDEPTDPDDLRVESCQLRSCDLFRPSALEAVLATLRTEDLANDVYVATERPSESRKVIGGQAYRVLTGRLTIGWRAYADWRVQFVRVSDDAEVASLVVEAHRAELARAAVW